MRGWILYKWPLREIQCALGLTHIGTHEIKALPAPPHPAPGSVSIVAPFFLPDLAFLPDLCVLLPPWLLSFCCPN